MMASRIKVLFLLFIASVLCFPAVSRAANLPYTSPQMAQKLQNFRKSAPTAFVLPMVFKTHPGATFFLMHAKDLNLSDKQIKKIRSIRRKMVNRSLHQIDQINKLKSRYLKLMASRNPSLHKGRKLLMKISSLMAEATFDHVTGHIKAGDVLTKDQWGKLSSLK